MARAEDRPVRDPNLWETIVITWYEFWMWVGILGAKPFLSLSNWAMNKLKHHDEERGL